LVSVTKAECALKTATTIAEASAGRSPIAAGCNRVLKAEAAVAAETFSADSLQSDVISQNTTVLPVAAEISTSISVAETTENVATEVAAAGGPVTATVAAAGLSADVATAGNAEESTVRSATAMQTADDSSSTEGPCRLSSDKGDMFSCDETEKYVGSPVAEPDIQGMCKSSDAKVVTRCRVMKVMRM
jgi:hypothetical protein